MGAGGWDNNVEEEFGSVETRGFGTGITMVVYAVATDSPEDASGLVFMGAVRDNVADKVGLADFVDGGEWEE